ncbi:MAG TPA: TIM barrel protein [Chitinophagaceae bacterium]|nr:TIM barrel protein [Chitinophagaceae bacterium]
MNRRQVIQSLTLGAAGVAISGKSIADNTNEEDIVRLKDNINHSVCAWTYNFLSLDELCKTVKKIGFSAIDLLAPKDWPTVKKHGITCSMCYTAGKISLTDGWNRKENHPWLIKDFTEAIPLVAEAGYKNLICFSGNRKGMDDETGMKNCADGLKQIMGLAEKNNVVIQMELFNSKVDHKDYMADKSAWGVELCKMIGSANFKLLYDIYHMQINEGDVIRTIQNNHQYFGHYHTAGVPGRHEIDETQELQYPAIMQAIVKTGYKGYVAQEFIPTGTTNEEKIKALKYAIKKCDV